MLRPFAPLVVLAMLITAAPASAQSVGTFRWQLAPYGSVLVLNIVQQGAVYTLTGFETQCGGNLSLPVSGVGVPQANGLVFLGLTSINENGRRLHTRAYVNLTGFGGSWSDNAGNTNQSLVFNPGVTCPGGPRTGPNNPLLSTDGASTGAADETLRALQAELSALQARLATIEPVKKQ